MQIKKRIQKALAKFIFDEDLDTIKLAIKVANTPAQTCEPATTTESREDVFETLHDHENRISNCEEHEYRIDEIQSTQEEMKELAEQTEVAIDEMRSFDFAAEFTEALAQPSFITLIETIIKNEREKGKKPKAKKKKA